MSPAAREIDAILYDFGGVVVQIDFDSILARWAELAGVPMAQLKARFSLGEAYSRHERSEIGIAQYYQSLRDELGIDLTDEQFTDGWQRVFGPEHAEVVEIIRRLQDRVPQYLFSNTNPTHCAHFRSRYATALAPFRRVFASCEVGLRKPEREAFEHVAREIGVPLERILFLDDTIENVEGARSTGMQAVHIRSPGDVKRALAPWLE